jgi:subtilisin family serine protease
MKVLAILLVAALGCVSAKPEVSETLLKAIQKGPQDIAIIVSHETTTNVISTLNKKSFSDLDEKTTALAQALKQATQASQREILEVLSQYKSAQEVQAYYITDRIFVKKVTGELLHLLSTRDDIAEIREPKIMSIGSPISEKDEMSAKVLEWGVIDIYAPEAWAAGYTGNGVRVSNIDTGARSTHSVLRDGYVGDDSYGWYDPDNRSPSSADDNGHGTHTLGTIAGKTGMGVAPNATWSACLGCPAGACPESALIGCGQWTFCPTLTDGTGEDCSQRPKVSSNSWGGGKS